MSGVRAIFLCAGFGTRMYPLTREKAKPLLEVGGEPLLSRLFRQALSTGRIADAVVVVNGRFHADFEAWAQGLDSPVPLTLIDDGVVDDTKNLGAIADLNLGLQAPGPAVDGYLVLAGDNLFELDLGPAVERQLETGEAQLLLREIPPPVPPRRYNEVTLDADGRVLAFVEKPAAPASNLAAAAIYALPPELPELVTRYLAEGGHPDAPGYLMEWLVPRIPFRGTPLEGRWFDLGSLDDCERAREWARS